jgi:hypothetical protein
MRGGFGQRKRLQRKRQTPRRELGNYVWLNEIIASFRGRMPMKSETLSIDHSLIRTRSRKSRKWGM